MATASACNVTGGRYIFICVLLALAILEVAWGCSGHGGGLRCMPQPLVLLRLRTIASRLCCFRWRWVMGQYCNLLVGAPSSVRRTHLPHTAAAVFQHASSCWDQLRWPTLGLALMLLSVCLVLSRVARAVCTLLAVGGQTANK